jgi:hypothetical protein
MSISSLLNEGMKLEDKAQHKEDTSMDVDDVATKDEDSHVTMNDFTPFSSEQTIRRLSPPPKVSVVSPTKEMQKDPESPPTSSRPVKEDFSFGGRHSSEHSRRTPSAPSSSRRAIDAKKSSSSGRVTRDKSAKAWQANLDLSTMDVESESD